MEKYDSGKLNFVCHGSGAPLILLHGWGCDLNIFEAIKSELTSNFKVYIIDLPGFGHSVEPDTNWGTRAYSKLIENFIRNQNIINPILLCHSFGGRIAIDLASRTDHIKALILTGSAGIKARKTLLTKSKIFFFKLVKRIERVDILTKYEKRQFNKLLSQFGSADYKSSSTRMKSILSRVVNEDLTALLSQIEVPTLLIWGKHDKATPIRDGMLMNHMIPHSRLIVFENAGHYTFLDQSSEFISKVLEFINSLNCD